MPNDTSWFGLEAGKVDTWRVDAFACWSWFWAVLSRTDAALVLQLNELPEPLPELPKLKNIEMRFQTLLGGLVIFYIQLKDAVQLELFETLCRDVMMAAEAANTEGGRHSKEPSVVRSGGITCCVEVRRRSFQKRHRKA